MNTPAMRTPPEERSAWIMLALAVIGYPVYVVLLLSGADGAALSDTPFAWPMVWTMGGSITASVILHALFRVYTDPENNERDERDRQIGRWTVRTEYTVLVFGALGGLVLAMVDADKFWIANAIFLGFFLSAAVGAVVKIATYRRGAPSW